MNDLDQATFDRFAKRFASIERLIPNAPVLPAGAVPAIGSHRRLIAAVLGVAIVVAASVGLAVVGSQPTPSPTPAAIEMPPDSAGPDVVLDAFLRAGVAGDCMTSNALKARLLAEKSFIDLCGLTDVTAFTVTAGPVTIDPDKVRFSGTVTITGIGVDLSAGVYRWTYFVQRQTNGAWRLVDGGYFAPLASPSTATIPPDSAEPEVVLDAYLGAVVLGDCGIADQLAITVGGVDRNFVDLCRVARLTAFSIHRSPIFLPSSAEFQAVLDLTSLDGALQEQSNWTFTLEQERTPGRWRIVSGQGHVPVSPPATPTPGPTRPTRYELQVANPELGGMAWTITEVDGTPIGAGAYLSFYGGPTGGSADGESSSDCWSVTFDYAYDPAGQAIALFITYESQSSSTEGCTDAELARYASIKSALSRVVAWRKPQADQIELLSVGGAVILKGGPRPPLPTAPPVGDCGEVPVADCERAAALGFNFDLFPASGQTVASWRVRPSIYSSCSSPGTPKYDVIFQLANPAQEWITTVTDYYGNLRPCGLY